MFRKKLSPEVTQTSIINYVVPVNQNNKIETELSDNKKMLTKGAMKVFEGLRVSIPTDDLDIKELLNGTFGTRKPENELSVMSEAPETLKSSPDERLLPSPDVEMAPPQTTVKTSKYDKKNILKKFGNKLGLKVTKKKNTMKSKRNPDSKNKINNEENCTKKTTHDVYDFEETQDNTEIFNKTCYTNLKMFRSHVAEEKKNVLDTAENFDKDSDSDSNR